MRKILLTIFSLIVLVTSAVAQGVPFRRHRYDGFKTHKVTPENIVFLGNSITNMHEWWEAFGNAKILNRGVNGAESPIMLEHLEAVLVGHPDKIFFMMGTNDLGTNGMNSPAFVAQSVRTALKRCKKESPTTKVYFQSILPCTSNGIKNVEHVPIANDSIKKLCAEYGATYIDLYNDLTGIANKTISYDGTHLTMAGYRTWCKKIASYVGSECVYPDQATDNNGGNGGIAGMRTTYFSALPIKKDDILIIGDDGNDWHELLHSAHVKQRGSSWGYKSNDIATIQKMVPCILKGRSDNEEPKMICLMVGYPEVNGTTDLQTIEANYKAMVKMVRNNAPHAAIRLMAVIPSPTASVNTSRTVAFNAKLKAMAESMDNVTYCAETYTWLVENNVIKSSYFTNNYMTGLGYAKLSQAVAKAIGEEQGVTPTTDAEATERIATFNARNTLLTAISKAESLPVGNGVGQYKAEDVKGLMSGIDEGYELLSNTAATNQQLTEKGTSYTTLVNAVLPHIIQPTLSTAGNEHWYQLYTPNRGAKYATSNGDGQNLVGGENTCYARTMWKFVERADGSCDIVNRADGTYINPSSAYDTAIKTTATQPAAGWQLSYANAAGLFIISSNKVELNQTNKENTPIYNWSTGQTGQDRADVGCQFAIVDAPEEVEEPQPEEPFTKGNEAISMATGTMDGGTIKGIRYGKMWTSTRVAPQITLSSNANNMWVDGSDNESLILFIGSGGTSTTQTLKVSNGYEITGVRFEGVNRTGQTANVDITINGTTHTSSATSQLYEYNKLKSNSVAITLSGSKSTGVVFKNFVVTIQKEGYVETAVQMPPSSTVNKHAHIYDLSGRRVKAANKGFYIINGKKVIK